VLQAETAHVEHIRSEIKEQVTSSWSFILQLCILMPVCIHTMSVCVLNIA